MFSSRSDSMEQVLDLFDEAWNGPVPPRIEDYLPDGNSQQRLILLVELIRIDLERRLAGGERLRVEDAYLQRFPELQTDPSIILALAKREFELRRRKEPELMATEYLQRFPDCQTEFLAQFPTVGEDQPRERKKETAEDTLPPFMPAEMDLRNYKLIETLGKGGMGEVYRARDPALGRDLAIKVMSASFRGIAEAERRFLREARVTGSLQHPSIVPVHNLGRLADGRLHYTMRLVRGQTFAAILTDDAGKPERLPALLGIFEKICQAVAYAHSRHVIHRDLKPANVMVGRFGEVQVMDWGLSKVLTGDGEPPAEGTLDEVEATPRDSQSTLIQVEAGDSPSDLTRAGSSMGTPSYMSPEQALSEWDRVDERTDVFALGAILCEMLTGKPPYIGHDIQEVLRRARRGNLSESLARLEKCGGDEALTALCRQCLAPERDDRPRDAGVVAQRVGDYNLEVQERLRRAELERVEAQTRAREEQARAHIEHQRATAERRANKRMFALLLTMVALFGLAIFTSWWIIREKEKQTQELIARQIAERLEREAESHWQRGRDLYQKGFLEEACAEFRESIRIKEDYSPGHNFLGVVLMNSGKVDEAITCFKKAIEVSPEFAYPYTNLGLALRKKGDFDGAIASFRRVIEFDPNYAPAHSNLGKALYDKGQLDDAIVEFREAIRLDPHEEAHHAQLGLCYWDKGEWDQAITAYREAVRLQPELPIYHTNLGRVLDNADRLDEAAAEYRRAVQLLLKMKDGPQSLVLANNLAHLGKVLLEQHKYREAEPVLRDCLSIRHKKEPDDWGTFNARSLLGEALAGQKKYAEAELLLVQGYEGMEKRKDKIPPFSRQQRLIDALERLVRLYEATEQTEKAYTWRKRWQESKAQRKK